jgi:hypothetical protein
MNNNEAVLRAIASLSNKIDLQNAEYRKEFGLLKSAIGNLERRVQRLGELIANNETVIGGVNQPMKDTDFIHFLTATVPEKFYAFISSNLSFKNLVASTNKTSAMEMNQIDLDQIDLMIAKLRLRQPKKKSGESYVYVNPVRSAWLGFLNKLIIDESNLFVIKPEFPLVSNVLG